jgi:hypothetical protein
MRLFQNFSFGTATSKKRSFTRLKHGFSLKNCKSLFQNRARLVHSRVVLEQAPLRKRLTAKAQKAKKG